jgi:tetratricopeptide (TPR) repeat protein
MSNLLKKLANFGGGGPAAPVQPAINLAVFGKHPGWDDHIPGIGMETEALANLKQSFYVTGIGGQIDSGGWEKLETGKRLEGFDHVFLWLRGGHALLGCLWSSTDRKGRAKYPMVLCADSQGVSPDWLLDHVAGELGQLKSRCQSAATAVEVEAISQDSQARLRAILPTVPGAEAAPLDVATRRLFLENSQFGDQKVGLLRILHELEDVKAVSGTGRGPAGGGGRSRHLRVPAIGRRPDEVLRLWTAFLQAALPGNVPLMLISRAGADWLEVIAGDPSGQEFFCLQASPLALPLSTLIPYEIKPELVARLQQVTATFLGTSPLAGSINESGRPPVERTAVVPASGPETPGRPTRKFPWLVITLAALAALGAVWFFSESHHSGQPADDRGKLASSATVPAPTPSSEPSNSSTPPPAPAPAPTPSPAPVPTPVAAPTRASTPPSVSLPAPTATPIAAPEATPAPIPVVVTAPSPAPDTNGVPTNAAASESPAASPGAADQQNVQQALKLAQAALDERNYSMVITQAQLALTISPTNGTAATLLKSAQDQLAAEALAQQQEKQYQAALQQAQTAFAGKDYTTAIAQAGVALANKPADDAALDLQNQAQHLLDVQTKARQQQEQFDTLMAAAQAAFASQDYATARAKAEQALGVLPESTVASTLSASAQTELNYQAALSAGRSALQQKDFDTAQRQAAAALAIHPDGAEARQLQVAAAEGDYVPQVKTLLSSNDFIGAFDLCNQHATDASFAGLTAVINQKLDAQLDASLRAANSLQAGDTDLAWINRQIDYWTKLKAQLSAQHQLDSVRAGKIDQLINKMNNPQ